MATDLSKYIRNAAFIDKVVSAQEAASWIEDGMTLGMSGFTLFGEPKVFPKALSERGQHEKFKVNLFTGASMGPAADQSMAEAGIINKRIPYQATRFSARRSTPARFSTSTSTCRTPPSCCARACCRRSISP